VVSGGLHNRRTVCDLHCGDACMKKPDLNITVSDRQKRIAKQALTVLLLAGIMGALFWGSLVLFGALSAVVYWVMFLIGLGFFPGAINVIRGSMPVSVGKFHIILMQVAFNHGYLVQREDRYEWCPGTATEVWIDGQSHDLEGTDNLTVFGWRPFGVLRYKEGDTWEEQRVDTASQSNAMPNGGTVERAEIEELPPDYSVDVESGTKGWWVLDLKRIYGRGVRKIGDIELYERAEEVIERGELAGQKQHQERPLLQVSLAMFFGVVVSFIMVMI